MSLKQHDLIGDQDHAMDTYPVLGSVGLRTQTQWIRTIGKPIMEGGPCRWLRAYKFSKYTNECAKLLGLLTQLQQDTKGNIQDIFLLDSSEMQGTVRVHSTMYFQLNSLEDTMRV